MPCWREHASHLIFYFYIMHISFFVLFQAIVGSPTAILQKMTSIFEIGCSHAMLICNKKSNKKISAIQLIPFFLIEFYLHDLMILWQTTLTTWCNPPQCAFYLRIDTALNLIELGQVIRIGASEPFQWFNCSCFVSFHDVVTWGGRHEAKKNHHDNDRDLPGNSQPPPRQNQAWREKIK